MAAVAVSYSKSQVDKAGWLVRDCVAAIREKRPLDEFDENAVNEAVEVVEWWRSRHAKPLARVNAGLRYYVKKSGVAEHQVEVTQRLKRFSTIIDKLEREPKMALSRMEDIAGVRAILPDQKRVNQVRDALDRAHRWKIRRIRNYIQGGEVGPKDDGYRAVHVIVVKDGCFVEIQLRTPWQDTWAQSVEQDTRRLRAGLKFGTGPGDLREYYQMVSELFAMREQGIEPEQEFMETLANRYRATRRYFPEAPGNNGEQR